MYSGDLPFTGCEFESPKKKERKIIYQQDGVKEWLDRLTLKLHVNILSGHSRSVPSNSCNKMRMPSYCIMALKNLEEVWY